MIDEQGKTCGICGDRFLEDEWGSRTHDDERLDDLHHPQEHEGE